MFTNFQRDIQLIRDGPTKSFIMSLPRLARARMAWIALHEGLTVDDIRRETDQNLLLIPCMGARTLAKVRLALETFDAKQV